MNVVKRLPEYTLPAWLMDMGMSSDHLDRRLVDAAADLVETMVERPDGLDNALYRFGNTLGADGWPIKQVTHWLEMLGQQVGRSRRKQLARYSSHAAVAEGWAEGYVRGAHTGMCLDPITGLATIAVLRMRLTEIYEQCAAFGTSPDTYTLLLIDIDLQDLPRLESDLLLATVASSVRDAFHEGETTARAGARILVLAANTPATRDRIEMAADLLRLNPSTRRANVIVLQEPLPTRIEQLDSYLRDLIG